MFFILYYYYVVFYLVLCYSLHAALTTYLNTEYKGDRRRVDRQRLLSNLPELSSDVKIEHATAVWCYTWKRFTGY